MHLGSPLGKQSTCVYPHKYRWSFLYLFRLQTFKKQVPERKWAARSADLSWSKLFPDSPSFLTANQWRGGWKYTNAMETPLAGMCYEGEIQVAIVYIYTYTLGSKQPMISISFIFIHHPQRISQVSKYSTFTPPSHTQMKPNGILSATPGESSNSSYLGWRKFQLCFTPFFLGKTCFFWSHKKGGVELRNAELLCQWQLRETLLHPVPDV